MRERHIYEYSIIRVNPRVNRGECLNIGVILYCRDLNFLKAKISMSDERLLALFPKMDLELLHENAFSFQQIVEGSSSESPIAAYDRPSRFRWLTANRSTIIQCSPIHSGLTSEAGETLERLFQELVHI